MTNPTSITLRLPCTDEDLRVAALVLRSTFAFDAGSGDSVYVQRRAHARRHIGWLDYREGGQHETLAALEDRVGAYMAD